MPASDPQQTRVGVGEREDAAKARRQTACNGYWVVVSARLVSYVLLCAGVLRSWG